MPAAVVVLEVDAVVVDEEADVVFEVVADVVVVLLAVLDDVEEAEETEAAGWIASPRTTKPALQAVPKGSRLSERGEVGTLYWT